MNCLTCSSEMTCLRIKNDADPAFFNSTPSEWRDAFVCPDCTPETFRRFRNA